MAKFITLENLTRFLTNVRNIIPTKTSQLENDKKYATQDEIPDVSDLASKIDVPTKVSELENDSGFITGDEIPVDYAKQSDIPTKTSQLENDSNFATQSEIPDVSNLADKSDIPTKTSDLTNDSNFATQSDIPDISNLASKDEIPDISQLAERSDIPTKTSQLINDRGFAVRAEIPDVSNFATKDEIPNVDDLVSRVDIPTKVSELENDSNFATKSDIPNVSNFATKDEIPDISNLATKDEIPDIDDFASKIDIPTKISQLENDENFITNTVDNLYSNTYQTKDYKNIAELKSDDTIALGDFRNSLRIDSKTRPIVHIADETVIEEIALKSEIPTDYAKKSDIPDVSNYITQTTLDNNYYTSGEVNQAIADKMPTKLAQLGTDESNQRVSVSDKTKWDNKSDFSGSYNDLTNKPNLSNYLTADGVANVSGRKTFTGVALQIAPTANDQPTYISVDNNNERFRASGVWEYIYLDGSTTYPTIRLMGYDMATKDDIPDTSNFATKGDIPDTSNFATKGDIPDTSNFATKDEIPPVYPVVAKYQNTRVTSTKTFNMSDYINASDYAEGAVYEVYIQGYLYGTNSHKTAWGTDILPNTTTMFNISGNGRQNGFVGSVAASNSITVTLNSSISGDEYCQVMFTGYRRLY